jgi:hypothetical protein
MQLGKYDRGDNPGRAAQLHGRASRHPLHRAASQQLADGDSGAIVNSRVRFIRIAGLTAFG